MFAGPLVTMPLVTTHCICRYDSNAEGESSEDSSEEDDEGAVGWDGKKTKKKKGKKSKGGKQRRLSPTKIKASHAP